MTPLKSRVSPTPNWSLGVSCEIARPLFGEWFWWLDGRELTECEVGHLGWFIAEGGSV